MSQFQSMSIDTASFGTIPASPAVAIARQSPATQYVSHPAWGGNHSTRSFESADTNRLNQAHWRDADDQSVNMWLESQLTKMRSRSTYEARQNGTVLGMINTHADDIVGPDGPALEVISDDDKYNAALEDTWRDWFYAPTHKPNVSGVSLLRSWVRSPWKTGEFLAQLITLPNADGPISLRIRPHHPRWLATPVGMTTDPNIFMGIRFDGLGRPASYYIQKPRAMPTQLAGIDQFTRVPADLIIHEFIGEEEDQARGIPWLNTALQPAADLRDYDARVMDAAQLMADQSTLLYCENPENVWEAPESSIYERRTIKMTPPGWKPFVQPATQPPVQYPDFRGERMRELGRPVSMPLLMIRLDASGHNYSSARLDTQSYARAIGCLQNWISGTERSYGTLNRLVDEIAKEGRFTVPGLRNRPKKVKYKWTWPTRPHVDRQKEATADNIKLENGTTTVTDILAADGKTVETHFITLAREKNLKEKAGLANEPTEPSEKKNSAVAGFGEAKKKEESTNA